MKTHQFLDLAAFLLVAWLSASANAQSTINGTAQHAWSSNAGWIDFRPARPNPGDGFKFGEFSCSGWIWSPNIGWVNCGYGTPANGVQYANVNDTDFGVNHSGEGDLSGLAWAPNVGWINFGWWTSNPTNTNRPRVDLATGEFAGCAWSANCGWINLATGQLKTDRMDITDTDGDGISDTFEMAHAGNLITMSGMSDTDGDGQSDKAEYIALTDPLDPESAFKITRLSKLPGINSAEIEWPGSPARFYVIEAKPSLTDTNWLYLNTVPGAFGGSTIQAIDIAVPESFFRVGVRLPLQP